MSICIGTLGHISRDAWLQMRQELSNEIGIRLAMKLDSASCKTVQSPNPTVHSFETSNFNSDYEINVNVTETNHSVKKVYFDIYDEIKKTWNLCTEDMQNLKNLQITPVVEEEESCVNDALDKSQLDDEKRERDVRSAKIRDARLRHFNNQ